MKLKVWLSYIFFIFTTIVVATVLSAIVIELGAESAGIRAFYKEPKNQIDAVFIGPSSIYTAFLPPIAYHKYGVTTAVYSISGMVTEQYIYILKEVMKYQTPKFLFIAADAIFPLQRRISNKEKVGIKIYPFIRPSINKIKMIHAFKKELKINNLEIIEYYFPIICFHSRWKRIKENSIFVNSNPHKGAVIDFKEFHEKKSNNNLSSDKQWEFFKVDEKRKQRDPNLYIKHLIPERVINKRDKEKKIEILQYVKNVEDLFSYASTLKNTKVIIISTPSLLYARNFERLQWVFFMGKKYGIYSFYMGDCEGLNIDLNNDFLDEGHLNFWGAVKATDYLSKLLVEKYGLKDKRNDIKYNSWNEEYEFYRNEIKRRYNIDIESGELINSEVNN